MLALVGNYLNGDLRPMMVEPTYNDKISFSKRLKISVGFLFGYVRYARRGNIYYNPYTQTLMAGPLDLDKVFLFDFREMYRYRNLHREDQQMFGRPENDEYLRQEKILKEGLVLKNPTEVLDQLEVFTPILNLDVKENIKKLNNKLFLIREGYAQREIGGFIERLSCRKNYKGKVKNFFNQFKNIKPEKLEEFLTEHTFILQNADVFMTLFSDKNTEIMKEYSDLSVKATSKRPVFYVITKQPKASADQIKSDMVILAQSPFGYFWQILGVENTANQLSDV